MLNYYEHKFPFSKQTYSLFFAGSWVGFLLSLSMNWTYVMILRGITMILIVFVLSHINDGIRLNPDSEYELGTLLLGSILCI